MSTFVHGIGASENIDSSGEIVSIAGLDISSLDKDGVLNWEHKSDSPAQVVGKILKAKKIFSDKDCDDDHQLYFWNKTKVPYLYVMGELLDDYTDSAREVAGKFRYDAERNNERAMMNFSVEGSKISKEGITVSRSIARKITITILPCNKAAVAEMVAVKAPNPKKSAVDELFKTEVVEIELFQPSENFIDMLKKERLAKDMGGGQNAATASSALSGVGPTSSGGLMKADHKRGNQIGITRSGQSVFSHGMVGDYTHFTPADHEDAAKAHAGASQGNHPLSSHHAQKSILHAGRAKSMTAKAARITGAGKTPAKSSVPAGHVTKPLMGQKLLDPDLSGKFKKSEGGHWIDHESGHSAAVHSSSDGKSHKITLFHKHPHQLSGPEHFPSKEIVHHGSLADAKAKAHASLSTFSKLHKASTAGSGICEPNRLEGGAALAKEDASTILAGTDEAEEMEKAVTNRQGGRSSETGHERGVHIKGWQGKPGQSGLGERVRGVAPLSSVQSPERRQQTARNAVHLKTVNARNMPKPNLPKSEEMNKGGAYSGNVPKEKKVKELQQKIDTGTYKPNASKIAGKMLEHPDKPLKKDELGDGWYKNKGSKLHIHDDHGAVSPNGGKFHTYNKNGSHTGKVFSTMEDAKAYLGGKKNLAKSEWLVRAESDYAVWNKREQFENFMHQRMPNLTKSEIKVIGQTMLLQKNLRAETALAKMAKDEKPHAGLNRVGQTRSGKHIYGSKHANYYKNFTSDDHHDAAAAHQVAGNRAQRDSHSAAAGGEKKHWDHFALRAHAAQHGIHKPEGHSRTESGTAARANLSSRTSGSTGFEKSMEKAIKAPAANPKDPVFGPKSGNKPPSDDYKKKAEAYLKNKAQK